MHLRSSIIAALSALLVILSGCGLFGEEDTTIVVSGTVVLAEAGESVENLGISLDKAGSFGLNPIVAITQTASDGTFEITYEAGDGDRSTHLLTINDEPYDSRYTVRTFSFVRGERRNLGVVEVELNED